MDINTVIKQILESPKLKYLCQTKNSVIVEDIIGRIYEIKLSINRIK